MKTFVLFCSGSMNGMGIVTYFPFLTQPLVQRIDRNSKQIDKNTMPNPQGKQAPTGHGSLSGSLESI